MQADRPQASAEPGVDAAQPNDWQSRWRRWRSWLPFLVKPLRRGIIIFAVLLVIEYLVVPELVGASKDLYLLGRVNPAWLVAGLALEALSLFCYGLLTQAVLPPGALNPGLSRLFRIDLAAAAVAHVIPAGTVGSAGVGYRLFTAEGIKRNDTAVLMATKSLGSTVVLNVLLWVSLVVSIPLAGFHPVYVTVAIIGAVVLLAIASLAFGITRQSKRASRILCVVGDRIPGLTGDRLEQAIRDAGQSLSALARDRRTLFWSLTWASLNWLLDAASLWCFVAAFGRFVNPFELFAAYGIANVAGVLPVTPAGLGVIDSVAPLLLVSFGITRSVATLGVLGWRLVNFWLPIPAGAAAYVSLKVPHGAGLKAWRAAVSALMTQRGQGRQTEPPDSPGHQTEPPDSPGHQTGPPDSPGRQTGPPDSPGRQTGPPDSPGAQTGPLDRPGRRTQPPESPAHHNQPRQIQPRYGPAQQTQPRQTQSSDSPGQQVRRSLRLGRCRRLHRQPPGRRWRVEREICGSHSSQRGRYHRPAVPVSFRALLISRNSTRTPVPGRVIGPACPGLLTRIRRQAVGQPGWGGRLTQVVEGDRRAQAERG